MVQFVTHNITQKLLRSALPNMKFPELINQNELYILLKFVGSWQNHFINK